MSEYRLFIFGIVVLMLHGCASMNESECLTADWRIVGLDDGTAGRLQSRVREYQKDCSKHGVTPNLNAYQMGHAEGLKRFCTRDNGFNFGINGSHYNGVCPQHLSNEFLAGYRVGHELYMAKSRVTSISQSLNSAYNEKDNLEADIVDMQIELVSDDTTSEQRATIVVDMMNHKKLIDELEEEIVDMENELAYAEREYERLRKRYGY